MAFPGDVNVTFRAVTDEYIQGVRGARNENKQFGLEVNQVGGRLPAGYQQGTKAVDQYSQSVQRATVDTKGLTLSMVGLGTTIIGITAASSRLDFAQNRLAKTQVAVRRIEDQIASTQKNLNRLIEQGKTGTEDYAVQVQRLETAYADLETKQEDVKLAQTALNDTQLLFATTVANTAINSLFLLKSAFGGLSLSQIKATVTTNLFTGKVAFSGAVAQLGSVKVGLLTKATHAFGTALKTALPPLLIIGGALAAWEVAIAPLIKQHTDLDLSIQGMMDSAFGAGDAMTDLGNDAKQYKELMGESTEATNSQADALRELFGLVENKDQHPMIAFWNKQIFLQNGLLEGIQKVKREMNDPSFQQSLDFQAGSNNGAVITSTGSGTANGSSTGGTWTGARGGGSRTQAESQAVASEQIADTITQTEDKKLDKAIADSVLKTWKEGESPKFEDVFGGSPAEVFEDLMINEFGINKLQQNQLRNELGPIVSILSDDAIMAQWTQNIKADPLGKTAIRLAEMRKTMDSLKSTYGSNAVMALRTSIIIENMFANNAPPSKIRAAIIAGAPYLGANAEKLLEEVDALAPLQSSKWNQYLPDMKGESSGFGVTTAAMNPDALRELARSAKSRSDDLLKKLENPKLDPKLRAQYLMESIDAAREAVGNSLRAAELEFNYGTNTGGAFMFGGMVRDQWGNPLNYSDATQAAFRARGMSALVASQGGAFGRVAGGGMFEIAPGLFTRANLPQSSDIQSIFRDEARAREIRLQQQTLPIIGAMAGGFGQAALSAYGGGPQSSDGSPISQAAIDAGFSASGRIGGAIRFRVRNQRVLSQRRMELQARDSFVNSRAGALERIRNNTIISANNFMAYFTGGRITRTRGLGRSQADALLRNPAGAGFRRDMQDIFMDMVYPFVLEQAVGTEQTQEILQGRSASDVFDSSVMGIAEQFLKDTGQWGSQRFYHLPSSATPSHNPRLAAIRRQKRANIARLVPRLGEFLIRVTQGRPITVSQAQVFARRFLTEERLESTLDTLNTTVSNEFYRDNIDTRNEVLELEARAYFIEREQAAGLA